MNWVALPLAGALVAGVALAGDQEPAPGAASARTGERAKVAANVAVSAKVSASGFLLSLRLPALAHETRSKGVPDADVKLAVTALREARVAPEEAVGTFEAAVASVDEKGPVERFGEFVQHKLNEGLRGQRLARAIRDEHDKRGIGKGKKLSKDDDHGRGQRLGQDPEAKAAHMQERGGPEDRAEKRSEKADDRAEKRSEKAEDRAEKRSEKAGGKPEKAAHGPGEAKVGKGKDK
jgi:hypothetical protein